MMSDMQDLVIGQTVTVNLYGPRDRFIGRDFGVVAEIDTDVPSDVYNGTLVRVVNLKRYRNYAGEPECRVPIGDVIPYCIAIDRFIPMGLN